MTAWAKAGAAMPDGADVPVVMDELKPGEWQGVCRGIGRPGQTASPAYMTGL